MAGTEGGAAASGGHQGLPGLAGGAAETRGGGVGDTAYPAGGGTSFRAPRVPVLKSGSTPRALRGLTCPPPPKAWRCPAAIGAHTGRLSQAAPSPEDAPRTTQTPAPDPPATPRRPHVLPRPLPATSPTCGRGGAGGATHLTGLRARRRRGEIPNVSSGGHREEALRRGSPASPGERGCDQDGGPQKGRQLLR